MKFLKLFLFVALLTAFSSLASAQVPVQIAPAKVGVINTDMFSAPTGGINRLVNALKTIEAEFKPRRDEISTLVTRFQTLQQQGSAGTPAQIATRREQAESLQVEITRKQEDARVAYGKRMSALTNPIRQSVFTALEAFTKQHGIDVLIDLSKFPDGVLLANKNADVTAAFIRDFNSKNP